MISYSENGITAKLCQQYYASLAVDHDTIQLFPLYLKICALKYILIQDSS